jgi:hypothetical protein
MAARSTRVKIKDQGNKLQTAIRKLYEHLQYLDMLADGRSEHITMYLPMLVMAIKALEEVFDTFIEGL